MPILTPEERVGTTLADKYRLDRILGAGGMGTVFAGVHTWTERPVAVKLLNNELAQQGDIAKRFLQEARTAAQLKHRNVVDVLDMGAEADGSTYMVLELLEGEPLGDRLKDGPMSIEEALGVLSPVMDALAQAHRRGIVHRDLKPDNIFLAESHGELVPKLLDFGIAKVLDGESSVATRTGLVIGTPQYMAPEQVRADSDIGPPADVWSMGVVLFQALSGTVPFDAPTPTAILAAILTQRPPPMASAAPNVPPAVAQVIDRALATDRAVRYPDMRVFADALKAAVGGGAVPLPPPPRPATDPVVLGGGPSSGVAPPSGVAPASGVGQATVVTEPRSGARKILLGVLAGAGALVLLLVSGAVALTAFDDGGPAEDTPSAGVPPPTPPEVADVDEVVEAPAPVPVPEPPAPEPVVEAAPPEPIAAAPEPAAPSAPEAAPQPRRPPIPRTRTPRAFPQRPLVRPVPAPIRTRNTRVGANAAPILR